MTSQIIWWYKGGGWNTSLVFLPPEESLDLLNKKRFTLWVVALLEVCDVTNNGLHLFATLDLPRIRKLSRQVVLSF